MSEASTVAANGMLVPAKYLPNLRYPHWKKWYNTKTWLSNSSDHYNPFETGAGRHIFAANSAKRDWHEGTVPARSVINYTVKEQGIDLTTPAYMLAGSDVSNTTGDTLVGLDYFNPPIEMAHDVFSLGQNKNAGVLAGMNLLGRVQAINHTFTIVNYSRFPLEVYYAVLPFGSPFTDIEAASAPHADLEGRQYRKIVVAGVRDAGDKGARRDIKISANLASIFPNVYDIGPMAHGSTSVSGVGGWFGLLDTVTSSIMVTEPPGQSDVTTAYDRSSAHDQNIPALMCRFYAKLQMPMNIGITSAQTDATGGDLTINSWTLHADMNWLVEMVNVAGQGEIHPGEQAYPDQT